MRHISLYKLYNLQQILSSDYEMFAPYENAIKSDETFNVTAYKISK